MRTEERLLDSITGHREAIEAAKGGTEIADAEHSASALARSIGQADISLHWSANVDVNCVREVASAQANNAGRFGDVKASVVDHLAATNPRKLRC
jgi:hypothetical protein